MTQQPTSSNDTPPAIDHSAAPQAAGDPAPTRTPPHDPHALSDAQAVALLRQWVEDYLAHPEEHSYVPSLGRMFFKAVTVLGDEDKGHAARHSAGAIKSYLTQPVGIPEGIPTTLDVDDSYTVFRAVLQAVQTWQSNDRVLPNEAAHRALIEAAEALQIMARAQLAEMAPLVQAHCDDERAAEEWAYDRWMARTQPARTPAGAIVASDGGES